MYINDTRKETTKLYTTREGKISRMIQLVEKEIRCYFITRPLTSNGSTSI